MDRDLFKGSIVFPCNRRENDRKRQGAALLGKRGEEVGLVIWDLRRSGDDYICFVLESQETWDDKEVRWLKIRRVGLGRGAAAQEKSEEAAGQAGAPAVGALEPGLEDQVHNISRVSQRQILIQTAAQVSFGLLRA